MMCFDDFTCYRHCYCFIITRWLLLKGHHVHVHLYLLLLVLSSSNFTSVLSETNAPDVSALNVMYTSMNSPSSLDSWKSSGGDPCGHSWQGITCSGSSVTEMDLSGLGLTGSIGYKLSSLTSVTYFDLSNNNLKGDIPYQLPPNAQHVDLSRNGFSGSVPYSISQMVNLESLNLDHNQLKGQLNDMFGQLSKLTKLDISYNSLTGNLPKSFTSLSSLNTLHLQNNQFTGSINVLTNLPLDDLTGGNSWSSGPAPPPPPGEKINPHAGKSKEEENKSGLSGAAIAGIILGVLVILGVIIALFSRKSSPTPSRFLEEDRIRDRNSPFSPLGSRELSNDLHPAMYKDFKEMKSFDSSSSVREQSLRPSSSIRSKTGKTLHASPSLGLKLGKALEANPLSGFNVTSSDCARYSKDNEVADHLKVGRSNLIHVNCYSLADLQTATCNFATARLLGEGSIGRVYKAKDADRRVLAVKKIDSSLFQGQPGEEFRKIVLKVSELHHPNIVELVGYCSEQGQNMMIYEYFRNGSLHEFLHLSDEFSKPLTWNTRVRIAVGTARALEYLHEVCSPSCIHRSIRSSNILLDIELNPHLSDCALDVFYESFVVITSSKRGDAQGLEVQ